ncbi:M20/M25/M40 family metallo-hydrolase [Candidatus Bipolaricaulota bacterium]|nr:M20/M25/M40 family metallo-hydrolase [Candidatus Bipolaricaulota bacterium]
MVSEFDEDNIIRFLQTADGRGKSPEELAAGVVPYCTDASALLPQLRTPLMICGLGKIEMAHQPDEYVTVDSLTDTINTFSSFFDLK